MALPLGGRYATLPERSVQPGLCVTTAYRLMVAAYQFPLVFSVVHSVEFDRLWAYLPGTYVTRLTSAVGSTVLKGH